jgi:hypothetical protein
MEAIIAGVAASSSMLTERARLGSALMAAVALPVGLVLWLRLFELERGLAGWTVREFVAGAPWR